MVERLNRTIKELLYKYLQSTNTKTITTVLPKIISNYNNSYHSTIKMAPNEVNEHNIDDVYHNILERATIKIREPIKVGDKVRIQLKKKSFTKGYKPKFSKEIYEVEAIEGRYYIIKGLDRKYLRAFIQKVGEVEKNISPVDLEGTRKGHLKELAKRPISEESIKKKEELEQQREQEPVAHRTRHKEESIPAPRPKRDRKKVDRLTY